MKELHLEGEGLDHLFAADPGDPGLAIDFARLPPGAVILSLTEALLAGGCQDIKELLGQPTTSARIYAQHVGQRDNNEISYQVRAKGGMILVLNVPTKHARWGYVPPLQMSYMSCKDSDLSVNLAATVGYYLELGGHVSDRNIEACFLTMLLTSVPPGSYNLRVNITPQGRHVHAALAKDPRLPRSFEVPECRLRFEVLTGAE